HSPLLRGFEVLLLLTFGALAISRRKASGLGEVLVILAMTHAALVTQRNTAPFALAAAPAAICGLSVIWREIRTSLGGTEPGELARGVRLLKLFWGVALVALLCVVYPRDLRPEQWQRHLTGDENFPKTAVRLMREGHWPGKLYNDYVWGGYL